MKYLKAREIYRQYQLAQVKQITIETEETRLRKYVDPFFARKRLPIKPGDLIRFKAELNERPISTTYKRAIYTNLATFLNFAFRLWGFQPANKRIPNYKKPPRREGKTYTEAEYERMRKQIRGREYKALVDLLFYGGLRRGEAMAITPGDLGKTSVRIDKTYTRRRITTPKTMTSIRTVELPADVMRELKAQARGKAGRIFQDTSYSTLKRRLDEASKRAGVEEIRVHDLRHSHITNLIYDGFTPQGIAKRVGHSNTETLFNTYAQTRSTEEEEMAKRLNRELEAERTRTTRARKKAGCPA